MKKEARELFDKIDIKKNLGLDFYQFETHVRDFVMELVEPTVQKSSNDHSIVQELANGYEGLKQKLETLSFDTNKFIKKTVSLNEFHQRIGEVERGIIKATETLNTDFKKMSQQFEVVKDKLGLVQTDLLQFNKMQGIFSDEIDKVYAYHDNHRQNLVDEIIKVKEENHQEIVDFKKRLLHVEEEIKACRFVVGEHTQFIRDYEIKQSIFESHQQELMDDSVQKVYDNIKHSLREFDLKLYKQRIEMSDEMQTVLANSRDELLRAFRREYMAKKVSRGTNASHLDNVPKQEDFIVNVEILAPVNIKKIEYDKELVERRVRSNRRPRRAAMPRTNTPPPKRNTAYHLLPWRDCITDSEKSFLAPSEIKEKQEEMEVEERRIAKEKAYQERLAAEEAEKQRKIHEEQERRKKEAREKTMTLEELAAEAESLGKGELREVEEVEKEDPEVLFLQEEERQLQLFYEQLYPPEILKQGVPDFARFLKLITEGHQWNPVDLMNLEIEDGPFINKNRGEKPSLEEVQISAHFNEGLQREEKQKLQQQDEEKVPAISEYKPQAPHETVERPMTPPLSELPGHLKKHNYQEIFSYIQDSLLQLRDEMNARLNEQLLNQEHKTLSQICQLQERVFKDDYNKKQSKYGNQGYGGNQYGGGQQYGVQQYGNQLNVGDIRGSRPHGFGEEAPSVMQSQQSFSLIKGESSDFGNLITQAAIEHASQITVDKCKYEFQASIHDLLRKAQARVIAHMRLENRNLLKLWSLRIRKEIVNWMAKAHEDINLHQQWMKDMDERGKQCEMKQLGIIEVLQKQMKSLEDQFTGLKDQQHRILFGSVADDDNEKEQEMDEIDVYGMEDEDEEQDQYEEMESPMQKRTPLATLQSQASIKSGFVSTRDMRMASHQSSKAVTPKQSVSPMTNKGLPENINSISGKSSQQILQHAQTQGPSRPLLSQQHSQNVQSQRSQNLVPIEPKEIRSPQLETIAQAPLLPETEAEFLDLTKRTPTHAQAPDMNATFAIEPKPESVKNDAQENQMVSKPPQIVTSPTAPGVVGRSNQSTPRENIKPPPSTSNKGGQRTPPQASHNPSSPFRRNTTIVKQEYQQDASNVTLETGGPPLAQQSTLASRPGLRQFKKTVAKVQVANKVAEVVTQQQVAPDKKTMEQLNMQKRKLAVLDMQIMALNTQMKTLEGQQRELEEVKVGERIKEHFKEVFEQLNIERLKVEFVEFHQRMHALETEMIQKMQLVRIMYDEVEAGFTKNARDRSDYLNHYERIQSLAETQIGVFKESLNDFRDKLDKLSTCILSVVNEEEALAIRNMGMGTPAQNQGFSNEEIRVTIPIPSDQGNMNLPNISAGHQQQIANESQLNFNEYQLPPHQLEDAVPRRNGDTGRFKNISELALQFADAKQRKKSGIQVFYERQGFPQGANKNSTLLPSVTGNKTMLNVPPGSTKMINSSRFNYTDLVDQALISSISNAPLDLKGGYAPPQYSNPLLRASVNGVISHRIKNLLGATSATPHNMFTNYSQQSVGQPHELPRPLVNAASALGDYPGVSNSLLEDQLNASAKLTGRHTTRKKLNHHSVKRSTAGFEENANSSLGASSMAKQLAAKNDANYETVRHLTDQKKGQSLMDPSTLKMHKQMIMQGMTPGHRNSSDEVSSPIMLHALVATNSISSKEIKRVAMSKHRKVEDDNAFGKKQRHEKSSPRARGGFLDRQSAGVSIETD